MQSPETKSFGIWKVEEGHAASLQDTLAVEEPLEIRLGYTCDSRREQRRLSITMRTPGHDAELAVGFLFAEGILNTREQAEAVRHCGRPPEGAMTSNVIRIDLTPDASVDLSRLERHFTTTSSCGVCGKTSLEALEIAAGTAPLSDSFRVDANLLYTLPTKLREAQ